MKRIITLSIALLSLVGFTFAGFSSRASFRSSSFRSNSFRSTPIRVNTFRSTPSRTSVIKVSSPTKAKSYGLTKVVKSKPVVTKSKPTVVKSKPVVSNPVTDRDTVVHSNTPFYSNWFFYAWLFGNKNKTVIYNTGVVAASGNTISD